MASSSGLWRRPVSSPSPRPPAGGNLRPDIDPPPRPRPFLQLLAVGLFVLLVCLQFLPATHFRHPSDPHRSWIPFNPNLTSSPFIDSRDTNQEKSGIPLKHDVEAEKIHVFSWSNCLDLRVLAVLANSTLSSSRYPERVHFHFIIPEGEDERVSYYKLKVLLPYSNLDIIGQKEIKEKLRAATPEGDLLWPLLPEIAPLVIPSIRSSLSRSIYISPDTIVKGKIEELVSMDRGHYAIAVADDCSTRLGDYVNIDVLNAIQRTAAKSWVFEKPYDKDACLPDLNILLLDANKLEKNILEAILWWSRVLDLKNGRSRQINPAIALAIYNKYHKISSPWKRENSLRSRMDNGTELIRFDGPRKVCSEDDIQHQESDTGNIWQQYLPSKFDAILNG